MKMRTPVSFMVMPIIRRARIVYMVCLLMDPRIPMHHQLKKEVFEFYQKKF